MLSLLTAPKNQTATQSSSTPPATLHSAQSVLNELALLGLNPELPAMPVSETQTDPFVFSQVIAKHPDLASFAQRNHLKTFKNVFEARQELQKPSLPWREIFPANPELSPGIRALSWATFLGATLMVGVDFAIYQASEGHSPNDYEFFNIIKLASLFYCFTGAIYNSSTYMTAVRNFSAVTLALIVPPLLQTNNVAPEYLLALPLIFSVLQFTNMLPGFSLSALKAYGHQRAQYKKDVQTFDTFARLQAKLQKNGTVSNASQNPNTFLKSVLGILEQELQNLEAEIKRYETEGEAQKNDLKTLQSRADADSPRIQSLIQIAASNLIIIEQRLVNLQNNGLKRLLEARETVFPEIVAETYALMQSLGQPVQEAEKIIFTTELSQIEARTKERQFALTLSEGDDQIQTDMAQEVLDKTKKILQDIKTLRRTREEIKTL